MINIPNQWRKQSGSGQGCEHDLPVSFKQTSNSVFTPKIHLVLLTGQQTVGEQQKPDNTEESDEIKYLSRGQRRPKSYRLVGKWVRKEALNVVDRRIIYINTHCVYKVNKSQSIHCILFKNFN